MMNEQSEFKNLKLEMNTSKITYISSLALAALIVAAYEFGLAPTGILPSDGVAAYWLSIAGVVLTLIAIPLALKWDKIGLIHSKFTASEPEGVDKARTRSNILRIATLFVPLAFNIICYYLFGCESSFAYMALMIVVAYAFIWPR